MRREWEAPPWAASQVPGPTLQTQSHELHTCVVLRAGQKLYPYTPERMFRRGDSGQELLQQLEGSGDSWNLTAGAGTGAGVWDTLSQR